MTTRLYYGSAGYTQSEIAIGLTAVADALVEEILDVDISASKSIKLLFAFAGPVGTAEQVATIINTGQAYEISGLAGGLITIAANNLTAAGIAAALSIPVGLGLGALGFPAVAVAVATGALSAIVWDRFSIDAEAFIDDIFQTQNTWLEIVGTDDSLVGGVHLVNGHPDTVMEEVVLLLDEAFARPEIENPSIGMTINRYVNRTGGQEKSSFSLTSDSGLEKFAETLGVPYQVLRDKVGAKSSNGEDVSNGDLYYFYSENGQEIVVSDLGGGLVLPVPAADGLIHDVFFPIKSIGTHDSAPTSTGGIQLLIGTSGLTEEVLFSTSAGQIYAVGGGGNDVIFGSDGSDFIYGDGPLMTSSVDDGNDTIVAGTGDDFVFGGNGVDVIFGGSGNDRLYGGDGDDIIFGGSDNDQIHGGAGSNVLDGGDGDDTFVLEVGSQNKIILGSGDKIISSGSVNDSLYLRASDITGNADDYDKFIPITGGFFFVAAWIRDPMPAYTPSMFGSYDGMGGWGGSTDVSQHAVFENLVYGWGPNTKYFEDLPHFEITFNLVNGDLYIEIATNPLTTEYPGNGYTRTHMLDRNYQDLVTHVIIEDFQTGDFGLTFEMLRHPEVTDGVQQWAEDEGAVYMARMDALTNSATLATIPEAVVVEPQPPLPEAPGEPELNEISGTPGADNIQGTDDADRIDAGEGDDIVFAGDGNDVIVAANEASPGGNGDDDYDGGDGFDTIDYRQSVGSVTINLAQGFAYGTSIGQDTLINIESVIGGQGNDTVIGDDGDNRIEGGEGDDYLAGGLGSDTYVYNLGDGSDTIDDDGAIEDTDVLLFGAGISANDIIIKRGATSIWDAELQIGVGGPTITLVGHFGDNLKFIDEIRFADNTVWDEPFIRATYLAQAKTAGDDIINGFWIDDIIDGGDGDDAIYAYGGDDILIGGKGNDYLAGGEGSDTYVFGLGDGVDWIAEWGDPSDTDVIQFGAGITTNDVQVNRAWDDFFSLELTIGTNWDQIRVINQFQDGWETVEEFHFMDSTIWTAADIKVVYLASQMTAGDDIIDGFMGDDVISGGAGDDTLRGYEGDDTLIGGTGDDYLIGGAGSDTFVFNLGDGADWVDDFTVGEDIIDVSGIAGIEDFNDILSIANDYGSGTTFINTSATDYIRLEGVALASLSADDFRFAA